MKKLFRGAGIALAIVAAAAPAFAGVGARVTGGIGYVVYADFNDFVSYLNDQVLAPGGASGTIDRIRWMPEASGEIVIAVTPLLEIGLGGGIVAGSSSFSFASGGNSFDYTHRVRSYPFTATAYVTLPALPFAKPYAFGGAGLYYTKIRFTEEVVQSGVPDGFTADLTKSGFGLQGGAGLAFDVAPRVAIDLGVKGRWASIKGFSGTATFRDGATEEVFLASYVDTGGERVFGPESTADQGVFPEGTVDLSGFAFTLALRVTF